MKNILGLGVLLLLCAPTFAQQKKIRVDAFDVAWVAALVGDKLSTDRWQHACPYCREGSPIKNSGARIGMQFGMLGLTKWLEVKNPNRPWTFRIFKGAMIGLESWVIIHNLNKGR